MVNPSQEQEDEWNAHREACLKIFKDCVNYHLRNQTGLLTLECKKYQEKKGRDFAILFYKDVVRMSNHLREKGKNVWN